jgi:DNA-binding MarR family transcriptional regulator
MIKPDADNEKVSLHRLDQRLARIDALLEELRNATLPPADSKLNQSVFHFETNAAVNTRNIRPPLPDPRLLRRIIRQRQLREKYFGNELFGDPAWDMLLDLAAAREEHVRVSITSLCIASGVAPTTALRWISQMTAMGLLLRIDDENDRRRAFVTLTDKAANMIAEYFFELGEMARYSV